MDHDTDGVTGTYCDEPRLALLTEVSKDQLIPITEQDLAQMPLPTAKAIDIVAAPAGPPARRRPPPAEQEKTTSTARGSI
ncbi:MULTISPECIES: hypothetical protein [Streptomyces]|uniref:Uncharacterized protein n=2 Tax=Streptomyces TaxID=1883 RepID=A0ABU4K2P9_9ACTN|nr:hypothetical protein [Streptomyces roseolus]MDX2291829.1 hypothetical protein [Streptomyces roseolus]